MPSTTRATRPIVLTGMVTQDPALAKRPLLLAPRNLDCALCVPACACACAWCMSQCSCALLRSHTSAALRLREALRIHRRQTRWTSPGPRNAITPALRAIYMNAEEQPKNKTLCVPSGSRVPTDLYLTPPYCHDHCTLLEQYRREHTRQNAWVTVPLSLT